MKAIIITQTQCPSCDAQKMFMKTALKGRPVTYVNKEENPDLFQKYLEDSFSRVTPTTILLNGDDVMDVIYGFKAADIKNMFDRYIK